MKMQLYQGRPADMTGRQDKEKRVYELLDRLGIAYERVDHLDILPGSVSVLGLMNDKEHQVQLLVDEDVLNAEYVGCHPCVNTSSLRLKTSDIFNTFLKEVSHDYITVVLSE